MNRLQVRSGPRLEMLIGTIAVAHLEMLLASRALTMEFVVLDGIGQEAIKVSMPIRTYRPRGAHGLITAGPVLDATDLTMDHLRLIPEFQEEF